MENAAPRRVGKATMGTIVPYHSFVAPGSNVLTSVMAAQKTHHGITASCRTGVTVAGIAVAAATSSGRQQRARDKQALERAEANRDRVMPVTGNCNDVYNKPTDLHTHTGPPARHVRALSSQPAPPALRASAAGPCQPDQRRGSGAIVRSDFNCPLG
jgi:hypothetical protein